MEMLPEIGFCKGIENYSRVLSGRAPGSCPYTLLDYFPEDFVLFVDESHVTLPQVRGMFGGDRSRKENLVEYGFRLPAARDNRPLTFDEFETKTGQTIYVSATPADYELQRSEGVFIDQLIRPTGLLDPEIEVRPRDYQVDNLMEEIRVRVAKEERVLVTTLTKRMAEELTDYLKEHSVKVKYMHSDIDTLERAAAALTPEDAESPLGKGITMTLKSATDALAKLGVEEVPTDVFNPDIHNAVMHVEDETLGEGAIVAVFQKGYRIGERIIRHATVVVAE